MPRPNIHTLYARRSLVKAEIERVGNEAVWPRIALDVLNRQIAEHSDLLGTECRGKRGMRW